MLHTACALCGTHCAGLLHLYVESSSLLGREESFLAALLTHLSCEIGGVRLLCREWSSSQSHLEPTQHLFAAVVVMTVALVIITMLRQHHHPLRRRVPRPFPPTFLLLYSTCTCIPICICTYRAKRTRQDSANEQGRVMQMV